MISPRRGFFDPAGRVRIVEHRLDPARPAGKLTERGVNRLLRQIGRHPEPQHEGAPLRIEPCGFERGGHASALEIVGDVSDMSGFGDPRFGEASALVGLRRRMVELEDAEIASRPEPIGESIETRAHDQDLPRAVTDCARAQSSAKRLRMAMNRRKPRRSGRSLASAIAPSASGPKIGSASGSAKTIPRSSIWCAARCPAAPTAVTLACPSCMGRKRKDGGTACRAAPRLTLKTGSPIDPPSMSMRPMRRDAA